MQYETQRLNTNCTCSNDDKLQLHPDKHALAHKLNCVKL